MKKSKFLIAVLFLVCGFILGACGQSVSASQERPLKIWKQNENGMMQTFCLVDEDTGVNYIVVSGVRYDNVIGSAITPRLNADGSLYVSK